MTNCNDIMTNYNDRNWHGWNSDECPVSPKSIVEYGGTAVEYIRADTVAARLDAADELADASNKVVAWFALGGLILEDPAAYEEYPLLVTELLKVRIAITAYCNAKEATQ